MKCPVSLLLKITAIVVLCAVTCCTNEDRPSPGDQKNYSPSVLQHNKILRFFFENHPGLTILKYAEADLDNDAQEDMIVIYRITKDRNEMCVVLHQGANFIESNSVPAPVSDQMIQFKNIDNKPPLEFILQGRKGSKVGYAIFRIEDGRVADLFGQGMEDCC
jgi:hypothetical protein